MDLVALNIQRNRDHGLPGYNKYREICMGSKANTWSNSSGGCEGTWDVDCTEVLNNSDRGLDSSNTSGSSDGTLDANGGARANRTDHGSDNTLNLGGALRKDRSLRKASDRVGDSNASNTCG